MLSSANVNKEPFSRAEGCHIGAERAIRYSTIAAVVIVAAVAASLSYLHALEVVGEHSRPSIMNNGFPLTVDGLIYSGSMVLLNDARRGLDAHPLAWFALGLGIAATLTVNVVSGLATGRSAQSSRPGQRSRWCLATSC